MIRVEREKRNQRVAEMTAAGISTVKIAEEFHLTPRTVSRIRRITGCARPVFPPLTDAEKATAFRLLEDGCSYAEAARTIGRSQGPIRAAFPGYSWSRSEVGCYAGLCSVLGRKVLS